jgi:hypothetical protein
LGGPPDRAELASPGSTSACVVRLIAPVSSCKAGAERTPAFRTGDAARSKHFWPASFMCSDPCSVEFGPTVSQDAFGLVPRVADVMNRTSRTRAALAFLDWCSRCLPVDDWLG